jgi:hypothetical protein
MHTRPAAIRRIIPILLAAMLVIGLATPVAADDDDDGGSRRGRPEVFPFEPIEQDFPDSCDFPVHLKDTFAKGKTKIYPPDRKGNVDVVSDGGFRSILTNLDTGKTIKVSFFGKIEYTVRTDGTIRLSQKDEALWWFTDPADAGMFGLDPGIYIIDGKMKVTLDHDFVAIAPAKMKKRTDIDNLCDRLAA